MEMAVRLRLDSRWLITEDITPEPLTGVEKIPTSTEKPELSKMVKDIAA
jgi:hypothetical protein